MKDIRYVISPYIIIPVIFSGISLLSVILGYQVAAYYINKGVAPLLAGGILGNGNDCGIALEWLADRSSYSGAFGKVL